MSRLTKSATTDAAAPKGKRSPPNRRILQAARAHFFSHGFRNVTMDDLAAELAVSKKTLYAHYPSKEALLAAVLKAKYKGIRATLKQATAKPERPLPEVLHDLLRGLRGELDELQPAFLRDMRKAPELFKTTRRAPGPPHPKTLRASFSPRAAATATFAATSRPA